MVYINISCPDFCWFTIKLSEEILGSTLTKNAGKFPYGLKYVSLIADIKHLHHLHTYKSSLINQV